MSRDVWIFKTQSILSDIPARGYSQVFFYSMTHFVRNLTPPMPDIIEFLIIEFFALRGESYTAKLDLSQLS